MKYFFNLIITVWLYTVSLFKKEEVVTPSNGPLNLDLQFFSDDGGDGGDGGDGDPGGDDGGNEKTFNQEEVDNIVKNRLKREKSSARKELAKELGFNSIEEMNAALKKPEPSKPKPKDEAGDGKEIDVDAVVEEKLKAEREKTFNRLVSSEVKVQANELGFADWEDALALADLSEVKEDDKGNITGVSEALKTLSENKPHLLKQESNNGGFGANIPNRQQQTQKNLENIKKMAQNRGSVQTPANDPWAK